MDKFSKYKAYRGNIIYSQNKDTLICKDNSYILILDGIVQGKVEIQN